MKSEDLELTLDNVEQAELVSILLHPGFKAAKKLLMGIVHSLRVDVDNAVDDRDIIAKQKLSRAAGIIFTRWVEEMRAIEIQVVNTPKSTDPIVDKTELDLDSIEKITAELPNFFGDAELLEEGDEQ